METETEINYTWRGVARVPLTKWSIIIPALNEEANLALCLASLRKLSCPFWSFEIIVVDNGSTDGTISVAKSHIADLNVRILSLPKAKIGALRNAGARIAGGSFLAFLDADCLPEPYCLQLATDVFNDHPSAIIGAYYALPRDASWVARLWYERFHEGRAGPVAYIPGGNMFMAASTFRALNGFDPTLQSNEDSQFCCRARAQGIPVLVFPRLAATHLGAEKGLVHFAKRQLWHGGNVISRSAVSGNANAIGLAAYTLVTLMYALYGILLRQPLVILASVIAVLLPPAVIALHHNRHRALGKRFPRLLVLVLTYSIVRAFVLPVAALRGVREWGIRKT